MFKFKRKNRPDVTEFKECQYCAVINNSYTWYDSKEDMMRAIEDYSKANTIYSLSMLRFDIYDLIK